MDCDRDCGLTGGVCRLSRLSRRQHRRLEKSVSLFLVNLDLVARRAENKVVLGEEADG